MGHKQVFGKHMYDPVDMVYRIGMLSLWRTELDTIGSNYQKSGKVSNIDRLKLKRIAREIKEMYEELTM